MGHYRVVERDPYDRKAFKDSGYSWPVLLFAPFWAFSKGLTGHGLVLVFLYGLCALLMGTANNGLIVGSAIALWLGVFSAHNATDWLTSSFEKQGYRMTGGVEANSAKDALRCRSGKGHRVLIQNVSSGKLSALTGATLETAGQALR